MRTAHFDCFSGISGDMVLGAVLHAGVPPEPIRAALDSLGLPIQLEIEAVKRCGFAAIKATIHAPDQEEYRFLPDILAILARAQLTARQRQLAETIFRKLAQAEATAHGMPLERVHFHEVGALDSIADIVAAAVGLDLLQVERFTASPVAVGSGTVKCAHGIMPVPTPGTAELLRGVPIAPCPVKGELATPTGVAILTSIVTEFVSTPTLTLERVGHGAGTKDPIEQPNILRLLIGSTSTISNPATVKPLAATSSAATSSAAPSSAATSSAATSSAATSPADPSATASPSNLAPISTNDPFHDTIVVLETNLDDCLGEWIGFTSERLFAAGALDVFTVPIMMKKQRPGVLLTVLCEPGRVELLETILLHETGTFGIRRTMAQRTKLARRMIPVSTPWGELPVKLGLRPDGSRIVTPEYEACAAVARRHQVPLRSVYAAVQQAAATVDGPGIPHDLPPEQHEVTGDHRQSQADS